MDAQVAQVMSVTGVNDAQARGLLEASNGNVEKAISLFFDTGATAAPSPAKPAEPTPAPAPASQPSSAPKSTGGRGGMATLADVREASDKNEYFAGGGQTSGQAIIAGPKDVMQAARDMGATSSDASQAESQKFQGAGMRLGQQSSSPVPPGDQSEIKHKITFYSNGFTVDDGDLRDTNSPEGQQFLNDIKNGEVPKELVDKAKAQYKGRKMPEFVITMEDKSSEKGETFRAFKGKGRSLAEDSSEGPAGMKATSSSLAVDESKEVTTVQIQLPDGSKLPGRFNVDHTVQDIINFVASSNASLGSFNLMTSYPRQVLSNPSATIAEAGLKKSLLIVKS